MSDPESISITNHGKKAYLFRIVSDSKYVSPSVVEAELPGGQSIVFFTTYVESIQIGPAT